MVVCYVITNDKWVEALNSFILNNEWREMNLFNFTFNIIYILMFSQLSEGIENVIKVSHGSVQKIKNIHFLRVLIFNQQKYNKSFPENHFLFSDLIHLRRRQPKSQPSGRNWRWRSGQASTARIPCFIGLGWCFIADVLYFQMVVG